MSQEEGSDLHMNSLFFLDDWLLFAREGLDRKQGRPEPIRDIVLNPDPDPNLKWIRGARMWYDPCRSRYVMVVDCIDTEDRRFWTQLESDDPCDWPAQRWAPGDGPLRTRADNVYVDQNNDPLDCFDVLCLAGTPLAEKGHVMTLYDYGRKHRGSYAEEIPSAAIGFSQDGLHFEVNEKTCWIPHHSDTGNPIVYSPWSGRYMIYCRPEQTDRRIDVVTTTDFVTFNPPESILQPDAEDPVGREFYGLNPVLYDDMFVGTLWIFDTEPTEKGHVRMQGTNEVQLAYSYNGRNWYRASREAFIPRSSAGTQSGGSVYAYQPVRTPDSRLLFCAMVTCMDHGTGIGNTPAERMRTLCRTYLYQLRLDGFAYLKTRARQGWIHTKAVQTRGGELKVNARTTPSGYVKAAVLDPATFEPIPDYTLEDALPLTGDELFGTVRWRERGNLDELKGRSVILEVHVREGELYALRFPYRVHLGEYARDRI
jgi:hypothetical protein